MANEALKPVMPSIEEAKEILKDYKRPRGNTIIVLNPIIPMVYNSGLVMGQPAFNDAQKELNKKGMLVVKSCFNKEQVLKEEAETGVENPYAVFEGDLVLLKAGLEPLHMQVITTENYAEGLTKEAIKTYIDRNSAKPNYDESELKQKYTVMIIYATDISATLNNTL